MQLDPATPTPRGSGGSNNRSSGGGGRASDRSSGGGGRTSYEQLIQRTYSDFESPREQVRQ